MKKLIGVDYLMIVATMCISIMSFMMFNVLGWWGLVGSLVVPVQWCFLAYTIPITELHDGFKGFVDKRIFRKKYE